MWNEHKDGGHAFPRAGYYGGGREYDGMSLRDWLAGMALAGIPDLSDSSSYVISRDCAMQIANSAYRLADAMLAARGVQS